MQASIQLILNLMDMSNRTLLTVALAKVFCYSFVHGLEKMMYILNLTHFFSKSSFLQLVTETRGRVFAVLVKQPGES